MVIAILLVLFIRSPWGQGIVVDKATQFVSNKTKTAVSIDKLYITFSGNLFLEGLYLGDTAGDTLIYSRKLEAGVEILPLIRTGAINITKLEWEGLKANISRTEVSGKFNFDFLIEAFDTQNGEVAVEVDPANQQNSQVLSIKLSPVSLKDFDLKYLDERMGIDAFLKLESLKIEVPVLNLEKSEFRISNFTLQNSQLSYSQTKAFEPGEEDSIASVLPFLILDNFQLSNVSIAYSNTVDRQQAGLKIGDFNVQAPEINLRNQRIKVNSIALRDSDILFYDFKVAEALEEVVESIPFAWPVWDVQIGSLSLAKNSVEFKTSEDQEIRQGYFNPEVLAIKALRLEAGDIFLENKQAGLKLSEAGFVEAGGFELKNLRFDFSISEADSKIEKLWIETNRSQLKGIANFGFQSIQDLIENPEKTKFDISLAETRLDLRDSYFFAPELAYDTLIRELASAPIALRLEVKGDLNAVGIPLFDLSWSETYFSGTGQAGNLLDSDLLAFDFSRLEFQTNRETLLKFVDESQLGVKLPNLISIKANASGKLDDILARVNLETDLGNLLLDGSFQNSAILAFKADLDVDRLQLGAILGNPGLDTLSFSLSGNGSGRSLNDFSAELSSSFERLRINGNDFSGLALEGQLINGAGDVHMWLDDEFLKFDLLTKLILDSINSSVDLNLDLKGIDLFELGFARQSTRAKFQLLANFEGNPANFDLTTSLDDAIVVYGQRTYPVGGLNLDARIREDSTSVSIQSLLLNGFIRSNTSPDSLIAAVTTHFRQRLDKLDSIGESLGKITMEMDLAINQAPILNQVLLQGLDQLDSARIKVNFNQAEDKFIGSVDFPFVKYGDTEVDSLGIRIDSTNDNLDLALSFLALNSGPLAMDRTYFTGELKQSRFYFGFNSFAGKEKLVHIASEISYSGDTLSIHVFPENLLVNSREWSIPETNLIQIAAQHVNFEDFKFSRNQQVLSLRNDLEDINDKHLAIQFENFRLETFTSLLNPNDLIASGAVNGRLVLENPFGATGLLGDLKVDSLNVLQIPLGNLSVEATSETLGDYVLAMRLKDGGMDVDLAGKFQADEAGGSFDVKLNLNQIDMEVVAGLSGAELSDGTGYLSGLIEASGTTLKPNYSGQIKFNDAAFVVSQLKAKYLLADETIALDNSGLYFKKFTIQDESKNSFQIDGSIFTERIINPTFDLNLIAKNFSVVNSTKGDNDLFYGRGIIDADVRVTGDLFLPKVSANLTVKENTELTVIIPESQLDLVARDGVVVFVNRSDPYDILTRKTEETASAFMGYDIRAILQVDPKASFRLVIDERSGDNLLVSGSADLNLEINPNGRITLSGNYEIREGHYEMSLYNLVSRKFTIGQGSRITWNGDPMDATLAISAIYQIRTASSELMASQLTGSTGDSKNQYFQELPFLVYLNVNGELLRPEISFRLDMPEAQRGALGGNVYSRVLQVNEQADELNKQVFSLLVLNRFFPSTGSDGSGGGTEAIARSSVSQVLSGQLNALSSNLLGKSGFELDFDLDSFTDYQGSSPQERTQLNVSAKKQLFDDRLVVQVGSQVDVEGSSQNQQQGNALLGNISIEYLLTKNGRYRLRGFQRNEFQSIIDGQLTVTGFGVIFNREFNTFLELWRQSEENKNRVNPIDELEKKNGIKKEEKSGEKDGQTKTERNEN
ncbi:Autotransporter translocation and assembly factor TamB [Algoriphagus alkaliphilus]|uniref:Autotransporter translocation and assembly factor TamB n=1 Tax=Algoriphagus alkaliphilus TaxID=279824 RepID=A0A1G5ZDU0_9BACT|nr:translocation/assembly module TamB [Algoriphagus alkaliphilus]SDA92994.1 Autotransporter translocation and assembly factor TamB [Algoriphagus alkaliphilus]